jgi:hypothetical protein
MRGLVTAVIQGPVLSIFYLEMAAKRAGQQHFVRGLSPNSPPWLKDILRRSALEHKEMDPHRFQFFHKIGTLFPNGNIKNTTEQGTFDNEDGYALPPYASGQN